MGAPCGPGWGVRPMSAGETCLGLRASAQSPCTCSHLSRGVWPRCVRPHSTATPPRPWDGKPAVSLPGSQHSEGNGPGGPEEPRGELPSQGSPAHPRTPVTTPLPCPNRDLDFLGGQAPVPPYTPGRRALKGPTAFLGDCLPTASPGVSPGRPMDPTPRKEVPEAQLQHVGTTARRVCSAKISSGAHGIPGSTVAKMPSRTCG